MVALLNYVKKMRCTIAGIAVQRAQFLSGVGVVGGIQWIKGDNEEGQ